MFDFIKKENTEKINEKDVGFNEDAILIICNLIHNEFHSLKSFFETSDDNFLQINEEARKDRTELMDLLIKNHDGENWCIGKHSLAIILGYMELFNRKYSEGKIEEAKNYLEKSKKWLGIFLVRNKL